MTDHPIQLTPSRRVHRVANRIGVVVAVPMLLIAAAAFGMAAYSWVKGPHLATTFNEITYYNFPFPTLKGDTVVFSDGSMESLTEALRLENSGRRSRHEAMLSEQKEYSILFGLGAVLSYIFVRSMGWIVAGAFKE